MPKKIQGESPFSNDKVPLGVKGVYKVANYAIYFLAMIAAFAGALFVWNTGTETAGVADEESATVNIN
jgi:hypothetical protein